MQFWLKLLLLYVLHVQCMGGRQSVSVSQLPTLLRVGLAMKNSKIQLPDGCIEFVT